MLFLSILFWAFFASYIVHILDETLLNGGFVKWIAENFWPTHHVRMFFWFNAAFIVAVFYLLIKYGVGGHLISHKDFAIGTWMGIATLGAFLTVGPTVLFPRIRPSSLV